MFPEKPINILMLDLYQITVKDGFQVFCCLQTLSHNSHFSIAGLLMKHNN